MFALGEFLVKVRRSRSYCRGSRLTIPLARRSSTRSTRRTRRRSSRGWSGVRPSPLAPYVSLTSPSRTVYQACELASEGKEDSVAAFMSRFFKLGIRVLCSPPVAPVADQPLAFSAAQAQAALTALQAPAVPLVPTSQATSMPLLPPAPVRRTFPLSSAERGVLTVSRNPQPSPAPLAAASSPLPEAFTFSQSMGDDRLFWYVLSLSSTSCC